MHEHRGRYPNSPVDDTTAGPSSDAGCWGSSGFPIGGLVALSTVGAIDSTTAALAGGATDRAPFIGAAQSLASPALPRLRLDRIDDDRPVRRVGDRCHRRRLRHLTSARSHSQGAISGAVIGVAQAVVLARRTTLAPARARRLWAPFLALLLGARLDDHHVGGHRRRASVHGVRRHGSDRRHRSHRRSCPTLPADVRWDDQCYIWGLTPDERVRGCW